MLPMWSLMWLIRMLSTTCCVVMGGMPAITVPLASSSASEKPRTLAAAAAPPPSRRRGGRALLVQREGLRLGAAGEVLGVLGVHVVEDGQGEVGDRLPGGDGLGDTGDRLVPPGPGVGGGAHPPP